MKNYYNDLMNNGFKSLQGSLALLIEWTAIGCIVLYKPTLWKLPFLLLSISFGRWHGVQPLCFRVGSSRQNEALPCDCGRSSALSYRTCPADPICQVKKAGFNGQCKRGSANCKTLIKSACLFYEVFLQVRVGV